LRVGAAHRGRCRRHRGRAPAHEEPGARPVPAPGRAARRRPDPRRVLHPVPQRHRPAPRDQPRRHRPHVGALGADRLLRGPRDRPHPADDLHRGRALRPLPARVVPHHHGLGGGHSARRDHRATVREGGMSDLFGLLNELRIPDIRTARQAGVDTGMRRRDVRLYIRQLFQNYGLPRSLADWAYNVLVEGASGSELIQRMYERPEFRERFRALFEYQRLNPNLPAISPADVLEYERQAAAIMRAAGMPPQFYDHWSDFVDLIARGVSLQELAERVQEGFERVATAPRAVREA